MCIIQRIKVKAVARAGRRLAELQEAVAAMVEKATSVEEDAANAFTAADVRDLVVTGYLLHVYRRIKSTVTIDADLRLTDCLTN